MLHQREPQRAQLSVVEWSPNGRRPAGPQPGTFPAQCAPLDFNGQIEMPEDMPDRVPEDMPDRMPEDMSDRMPEDMSDRMPEDLPASNKMYTCHGGGDHTK